MSGIPVLSNSPTNLWRNRGYQDALESRSTRIATVRERYGQDAAMAYAGGYRRGKERREAVTR